MTNTHVALLINQHQPLLRDLQQKSPKGAYQEPWVRLYAAKDYYQMAALLERCPRVHATLALMPSLLWQIRDYVDNGATDIDFELSATPAAQLSAEQRQQLTDRLFRVSFERQILPSARYTDLYMQRLAGATFDEQELTDLQALCNLAWIHPLLREERTQLHDGTWLDLRVLATQDEGYSHGDVLEILEAHLALLRNVIPLHKALAERGQLELATGPFYAPILPLLWDNECTLLDRADAVLPERFRRPADVRAQVDLALEFHQEVFGVRAHGLWPPGAALSEGVVEILEEMGIEWTVVAKSSLRPTEGDDPDFADTSLFTHPWRAPRGEERVALFPRESWVSDCFEELYSHSADYREAAREALASVEHAVRFGEPDAFEDEVVTIAVDGDHPWTSYRRNGVDFLRGLFEELSERKSIATVTFHEYLAGSENKDVRPHPTETLPVLARLQCASFRDEAGSAAGADFGVWIGEAAENEAWDLLRRVAQDLDTVPDAATRHPLALHSLLAAEEATTFRWLGDDNDPPPGKQSEQMALFRMHLENVYHLSGRSVPHWLTLWEGATARPTAD